MRLGSLVPSIASPAPDPMLPSTCPNDALTLQELTDVTPAQLFDSMVSARVTFAIDDQTLAGVGIPRCCSGCDTNVWQRSDSGIYK